MFSALSKRPSFKIIVPVLAAILLIPSKDASAGIKDTVNVRIRDYREELGYFQKANRDIGDPHFMFMDEGENVEFGIGGIARVSAFYGFGGEIPQQKFAPSEIMVPTENTPGFGARISSSELFFKARAKVGNGHKIITFVKINGNDDNMIKFDQAYISLDGFSLGLIPSFFMDLEVGVMNTGAGHGSQVDLVHPLFGYQHRFNENWSLGVAVENPQLALGEEYAELGIVNNFQPLPDGVFHVKFNWKNGHIQLGSVIRNLTYRSFHHPETYTTDGDDRNSLGLGFALTGNYKPTSRLKLSWELVSGKGIASYMANLHNLNIDLGIMDEKRDNLPLMASIPVSSGHLAAQYDWSDKLSSSVIVGYTMCHKSKGVDTKNNFKSSMMAMANFFWDINDYAYMGVEYLYGHKDIYSKTGEPDNGNAHRIVYLIAYCF